MISFQYMTILMITRWQTLITANYCLPSLTPRKRPAPLMVDHDLLVKVDLLRSLNKVPIFARLRYLLQRNKL